MTAPFSPQLLGQTEKALNALLLRELAGTEVDQPQWIALTLAVQSDGALTRRQLTDRVAGALQVDAEQAGKHLHALTSAGLLVDDGRPQPSLAGHTLWNRVRAFTMTVTQELWGDLPAEDLDTAARVLSTVLGRAGSRLATE